MTDDGRRKFPHLSSVICHLSSLLLVSTAFAQQDFTLEQAIQTGLRQNRDLATLQLNLQASYVGVEAAEAQFGAVLKPDGRAEANDNSRVQEVGLIASKELPVGSVVQAGVRAGETEFSDAPDEKRAIVHLQIQQPLFRNFGTLVNEEPVVRAKNEVLSARRRLELQKTDLIVQIVETHEDVLRLQQQMLVDQRSYTRFDQLYRLSQLRERQGRTTRVDTLRAEFERGRAELNISTTTEQLNSRREDMMNLLALPADTVYVAKPGSELSIATSGRDEAYGVALANRLDYAEAIQDLRDAARGVAIAERQLLPDINMLARYEKNGKGDTFSDATTLDGETWFVGFSGDTDVPPRSQRATLNRAKITEETAEQKIDTMSAELRLQVQQALLAYDRARKEVVFSERNHSLANDRARLARRLFNLGRETSFNVTDAETELLQSESSLLASRADVSVSAYRLLRVLGTLIESPEDLRPTLVNAGTPHEAAP